MLESSSQSIEERTPVGGAPPTSGTPGTPMPLTGEDAKRATDRAKVAQARKSGRSMLLLWLLVGPGILVILGENDGPSMLSYAQTGAQYGIGFFVPFIAIVFLAAFVVQEMAIRLGAATNRGHAELIFDRFGPFWGWFAAGDLALGNFLTLVTEFIAIRAGLGFFGIPPLVAVGGSLAIIFAIISTARYWTWERVVLGLAIFNGLFVPVALLTHPNWGAVGHSFVTWGPLPGGWKNATVLLLLSNIGATVTPWMLFFHQSATADKGMTRRDVRHGRIDLAIGTTLGIIFAVATVIATAPLYTASHGVDFSTFQAGDFAQALEPIVGSLGATLFALGIFEAGLVAAVMISTSSAYAFGEVARKGRSLNRTWREGAPFYAMLLGSAATAAALVLIPGMPLVTIVLLVNVVAVLAMPPALLLMYLLVNDPELMGRWRNGPLANAAATSVVVALIAAGVLYGATVVFPNMLGG
ncbi:MAG: NRAMP family divalent metal transporter [Thermoplasmatota archaeon]